MPAKFGDTIAEGRRDTLLRPRDTFARHVVDQPGRLRADVLDSLRRCRRRNQPNVERAFARLILFRRKIEDQEAVDSRGARGAMELFEAELEYRVQVSVENNRNLRALANLSDAFENAGDRRPGFESALGSELVHKAVGQRIRKGNAQLED